MDIDGSLAAVLAALTRALDDPAVDIATTLTRVATDSRFAVSSFLGLSVVVQSSGEALELTALDPAIESGDIKASLLMPLRAAPPDPSTAAESVSALILYAGVPGAFVDLAADLAWVTGWHPAAFVMDGHLNRPEAEYGPNRLQVASTVNQAIGILIARGSTPEQAAAELDGSSDGDRLGRSAVAREIIASLDQPE